MMKLVVLILVMLCEPALAEVVPATPVVVVPPPGAVDYGQAFGWLQPYVIGIASTLIMAAGGWLAKRFSDLTGVQIDAAMRDAYLTAAKNQAALLIAKGFVEIKDNGKVVIPNSALAAAANDLLSKIPDAAAHFDLDHKTKDVQDKIEAMIHTDAISPVIPAKTTA